MTQLRWSTVVLYFVHYHLSAFDHATKKKKTENNRFPHLSPNGRRTLLCYIHIHYNNTSTQLLQRAHAHDVSNNRVSSRESTTKQ